MKGRKVAIALLIFCLIFGKDMMISGAETAERKKETTVEVLADGMHQVELPGEFPIIATAKNEAEFKVELRRAMEGLYQRFAIQYTGTDAERIAKALWRDSNGEPRERRGEYFFGTEYWQWVNGVLTELVTKDGKQEFRFEVEPLYTPEQWKEFNKLLEELLRNLTDSEMSDYEKIMAVHDYIVLTKYYFYGDNNPYLFLKEGRGVISNYALLGHQMLEKLGFRVRIVVDEEFWNKWLKVELDGQWYNLDMYGDELSEEEEDPNSKTYLQKYRLISDQKLKVSHDPQHPNMLNYPAATSAKYDGMNDGATRTFSEAEIEELLYKGAEMRTDREFQQTSTRLKTPYVRKDRPTSFTVRFNRDVDRMALSKIKLYRLEHGRKVEVPFTPSVNGSVVTLSAGVNGFFANGIYYVSVEKGIRSPSGEQLRRSYYRKIRLDWSGK